MNGYSRFFWVMVVVVIWFDDVMCLIMMWLLGVSVVSVVVLEIELV